MPKKISTLGCVAMAIIWFLLPSCTQTEKSSLSSASAGALNTVTEEEQAAGWKLLFDGKTFKGWRGVGRDGIPESHWVIEEGAIKKVPSKDVPLQKDGQPVEGGDIMTVESFEDFELELEWKISAGGNSGIKYNVSEEMSVSYAPQQAALGFEYQVLDDERHPDAKAGENRTAAALYDLIAPQGKKLRPVGEFNQARIVFKGNHGEHWLNGVKVLEYELDTPLMAQLISQSKFKDIPEFARKRKGHIVLQDHTDAVWFRNIKIRELRNAKKVTPELKNSFREDKNGWIFIHLEGAPGEIGFQQGYLLAFEIDDALQMFAFYLERATGRDWKFYRDAAEKIFWPKIEKEYQEEVEGIAAGLNARLKEKRYDRFDITALNGWIELAMYYVPYLDEKAKEGAGNNRAPSSCSAFIATGSYTDDGQIVIGHNAWVDYIVGERWDIIADIVPEKGFRIFMDSFPGYIHSGDDFVLNSAGILYTETTISQFKGFKEDGTPEFMRARKAAQYADSIDDFIRIMSAENNGAYANDWLVGDLKTNEIARLELGLKNQPVWRTKDGYFIGSNFPSDEKLIAEETTFNPKDASLSVLIRKARWEKLMKENRGKINAEKGKLFEGDHFDTSSAAVASNGNVLCGHVDDDPKGLPEFIWTPYFPGGSVQGKVTTAKLAKGLKLWARMGHPCGRDFIASKFFEEHPEYRWQEKFLKDMKSHPWTLFKAKK
jgi:hypothetical protein